jgi:hypothetical protein
MPVFNETFIHTSGTHTPSKSEHTAYMAIKNYL